MTDGTSIDAAGLAADLIRCASVTPAEGGALDLLQTTLEGMGFQVRRLPFDEYGHARVDNLYARWGHGHRNFCFAGHTDVVPPGDEGAWTHSPFSGAVENGELWGRGAVDMKGAVAAFVAAADGFLRAQPALDGSISLLITGDEEGEAINGTKKVLKWLADQGEHLDACLVGEPTNPRELGEMMKIGRRGSLNATLAVYGAQGHVAYPHLADNPTHTLTRMLSTLIETPLDEGTDHFDASSLQITTMDVGNAASNVIPATAAARFNIRFNDRHTGESLTKWLKSTLDSIGGRYELDVSVSGEAFVTEPGPLTDAVAAAAEAVTGRRPQRSTSGGTSDARFIQAVCPVVEFGLVGQTMHQIDERTPVGDVHALTAIYGRVLENWFAE